MPGIDPASEARIRASFARQGFMIGLQAQITKIETGTVEIGLTLQPGSTQQDGFAHAGVLSGIADSACGYAAMTLLPPDHEVLTVEFKINFLAPARGAHLQARGRVLRGGRRLSVCVAEVHSQGNGAGELVATMSSTIIGRPPRPIGPMRPGS